MAGDNPNAVDPTAILNEGPVDKDEAGRSRGQEEQERFVLNKPQEKPVENKDKETLDDITAQFDALTGKETPEAKPKETPEPEVKPEPELEPEPEVESDLPPTAEVEPESEVTPESPSSEFEKAFEEKFSKKMSTEAREFVSARLRDLSAAKQQAEELKTRLSKAGGGELPDQWYQHKDAYVLDPSYQKAHQEVSQLSGISNFYKEQLLKIEQGEDFQDLVQNPDGSYGTVTKEATTAAKIEVQQRLNYINSIVQNRQAELHQLQTTFADRVDKAQSAIKSVEDQYFPQFVGDKGASDKYVKEMSDLLKSRGMQGDLLAGMTAKMYAAFMHQNAKIKTMQAELKKAQGISRIQQEAGPTSSEASGSIPTTPNKMASVPDILDAFEKIKDSV